MSNITVQDLKISIINENGYDLLSLTDMVKLKDGDFFITDWLRNKNTLDYISVWERLNNPDFNYGEFAIITNGAGRNSFKISVKDLTEKCNAKSLTSKTGRYGGTYAHKDIAFHFGMWISAEFQLLLVTEYQRLKEEENRRLNSDWDYRRFLSKVNYIVHTDAIKNFVLPQITEDDKKKLVYADEGDILNVALFGCTAKQWREADPGLHKQGLNIRANADAHQLLVLSNLEGLNASFNQQGMEKYQRLLLLRKAAIHQLNALRASTYTIDSIKSPYKRNIPRQATPSPTKISSGDNFFDSKLNVALKKGTPPKK